MLINNYIFTEYNLPPAVVEEIRIISKIINAYNLPNKLHCILYEMPNGTPILISEKGSIVTMEHIQNSTI